MDTIDRILPLCDLLLGAAYADGRLDSREQDTVRELLADLSGGEVPAEVDAWIRAFDPKTFDLETSAGAFKDDPLDERKRLLFLVDAVHEADEELDLAEDRYITALASALALPTSALAGLTAQFQVGDLRASLDVVRKGPPPIPSAR